MHQTPAGMADTALNHPSARWTSVLELLHARSTDAPDSPAIAFPGARQTYVELLNDVTDTAERLRASGVQPGDRVGILLREATTEYVALGLAIMRVGAICVPINARNRAHEVGYVVNHAGVSLLLTSSDYEPLLASVESLEGCSVVILGRDALATVTDAPLATLASLSRDMPALLLYTSGTTANPKGCLHTHATLLAQGYNTSSRLGLTAADCFWTPLAMFHVGGWQGFLSALTAGACFSHVGVFESGIALDQLERDRCTVAMPAFELIWMAVLEHPRFSSADLSSLRLVMNVGVPERLESMQQLLPNAPQISMIGMTEACGSVCIGEASDPLSVRTRSSGRPLEGMEVRVIGEGGRECEAGLPGELLFRGPSRFDQYFRDPETTTAAIDADGWVHTGDVVTCHSDGTVSFVGRLKDMLKVGGENVAAAEIEGYLITHPAISLASVVAAPDRRYGEVPCAFVQAVAGAVITEQELIDYCLGRIATFKVPRYVRFIEEYPVSASSKIQKFVLRERIEAELRELGITEAPKLAVPR